MQVLVLRKIWCCCCGTRLTNDDSCPVCGCEAEEETCPDQPFCTQCGQRTCWGHDDQAEEIAD